MRSAIDLPENPNAAQGEGTSARKLDRLALLYEGILTATCRVHTGRQKVQDPEDFRGRMKDALTEVASTAARRGYAADDVQESTYAVVAFLDEVILTASGTTDWVGKSLGEELFNQRDAGEHFFKRLDALRANRDSQNLAEILEVYYLCLLLGYEGKFAGGSRGELLQIMANLRERIERILGRDPEFSPDRMLPDEPPPPQIVADPLNRQLRLFALAAFVFAFLCYVGFFIHLHSQSSAIQQTIEQRITPGGAQ
jgi:type VI secretion system protein ImpK